jgi:hypothetical protein
MKRPLGVTVVAVLMCIGAGLLALGSLAFFALGAIAVTAGAEGPMSQLFFEMRTVGTGIFLAFALAYATLAILMWRLVYWARLAATVFIAVGLLFAVIGILASWQHPDAMVFCWQLFVIAVDAWILWYLARPHVKDAFTAQWHHLGARVEART